MFNTENIKKYADTWEMDMSTQALKTPEIYNEDVINQSIEMILSTPLGSRLFNLGFGSNFSYRIFDNMNEGYLEQVINDTVKAIQRWEDRIVILEDDVRLTAYPDDNAFHLLIPYFMNDRNIRGVFSKIIRE